jgi:hypothetical protein
MTETALKFQHLLEGPLAESDPISEPQSAEDGKVVEMEGSAPMHRTAAALLIQGHTPERIAAILKVDKDKCKILLKQEQTQAVIAELAQSMGNEAAENVLKATELDTIFKLIELRDYAESHSVQLNACKELLSRRRGNQPIRRPGEENEDGLEGGTLSEQVHELDQRIKAYLDRNHNQTKDDE